MSAEKIYALIQWSDAFVSIIDVVTIISPRNEVHQYRAGEYITARYKGNAYRAVICELKGNRKYLEIQQKMGYLKHTFKKEECEKADHCESRGTKENDHDQLLKTVVPPIGIDNPVASKDNLKRSDGQQKMKKQTSTYLNVDQTEGTGDVSSDDDFSQERSKVVTAKAKRPYEHQKKSKRKILPDVLFDPSDDSDVIETLSLTDDEEFGQKMAKRRKAVEKSKLEGKSSEQQSKQVQATAQKELALNVLKKLQTPTVTSHKDCISRKEFDELKEEVRRLKRKVKELNAKPELDKLAPSNIEVPPRNKETLPETSPPMKPVTPITPCPASSQEELYNGYKRSALKDNISHLDKLYDVVKCLMTKLFPDHYILSHSVSGKAANSKVEKKMPFDARLYSIMVNIIKEKFANSILVDVEDQRKLIEENKKELQTQLQTSNDILLQEKNKHEELTQALAKTKAELKDVVKNLNLANEKNDNQQQDILTLAEKEKTMQGTLNAAELANKILKEKSDNLMQGLEQNKILVQELQSEKNEQDKSICGQLESQTKEKDALEDKMKNLKESVATKGKHIKDLEKEIRSQKFKCSSQRKTIENNENEITKLTEVLEEMRCDKERVIRKFEDIETAANAEKISAEQARQAATEMKILSEHALQDKENSLKQCELRIVDMSGTLEKYQQENQKLVFQKEREIEALKDQLDIRQQAENFSLNEKVNEIQELKEILSKQEYSVGLLEEEKKCWENKSTDVEQKMKVLKEKISAKDKKISEFKKAENAQKKRKFVSSETQTDRLSEKLTPQRTPVTPTLSTPRKQQVFQTPKTYSAVSNSAKDPPTPKTPTIVNKKPQINVNTPKVVARTPQGSVTLKTPQRSILKHGLCNSATKRRKVAFASEDENNSESSDTDSSQLMEVEMNDIEDRFKGKSRITPLQLRPSPKWKNVEEDEDSMDFEKNTKPSIPLQIVPRGPSARVTKKKTSKETCQWSESEEKEHFRNVYPSQMEGGDENQNATKSGNVRKTPNRTPGKFFKSSPKDRSKKDMQIKGKEETSWFDLDSVFGFDAED